MKVLEIVRTFFEGLDEKKFSRYLSLFLGIIVALSGFIVFRYYQNISYLQQQINIVNEEREEAQQVLEKSLLVQQQRKEVNRILEEDPDFKILGYFEGLVEQLNLPNPTEKRVTETDRDDEYRESILEIRFTDMNMKQLAELLQSIEQNKRIYSKALEISKSKKQPKAIEVNLSIATLHKKAELT